MPTTRPPGKAVSPLRAAGRLGFAMCIARSLAAMAFVCVLVVGCASPDGPALTLVTSTDRDSFKIGEPFVLNVVIENNTDETVLIPRFDNESLSFTCAMSDTNMRLRKEPVHSTQTAPNPREILPYDSATRSFVFTRVTDEPGTYALLTSFKGAVVGNELLPHAIFAKPLLFTVSEEIALKRDPHNGLILKAQALDLAKASAKHKVTDARALLTSLGETGLYTWVVFLTEETAAGGRQRRYSVRVNPYTGKVAKLVIKQEKAKSQEPTQSKESTDTSEATGQEVTHDKEP